jgi:pimeloyl-ACP methyl ester carboxylesterase
MPKSITPGTIIRRSLDGMQQLDYFAYVPSQGQRNNRVFISVHGISRNAEQHLQGFAALAEHYGAVMLAPLFPKESFPFYQRLGSSVNQERSDLAFDQMLQDAAEWLGIRPDPLHIFGFSGGGQFTHRYAMFYPKRVARMVLGAPGWYTFPDPELQYPLGLRSSELWPRLKFSPARFLKVSSLVLVGEEDDIRDEDLNTSRRIDASQGLNRFERGERWVNAMRSLARAFNVPSDFRFESVANANHAYESYLAHPPFAEQVFSFLFGQTP